VMIARIGGTCFLEAEYEHRASSRRLKSSSGVQDVLLTSRHVFPAIMSATCLLVSGNLDRKACRVFVLEIGWNMAAGRS